VSRLQIYICLFLNTKIYVVCWLVPNFYSRAASRSTCSVLFFADARCKEGDELTSLFTDPTGTGIISCILGVSVFFPVAMLLHCRL
jgi:hypothetical protein